MPSYWFLFSGVPNLISDPMSYTLVGSQPTTCAGTNQVCAIYVASSSGYPVLTRDLKSDIIYALSTRTDIPGKVLLKY